MYLIIASENGLENIKILLKDITILYNGISLLYRFVPNLSSLKFEIKRN